MTFLNYLGKLIKIWKKTRKIIGVIQHYSEGPCQNNNIRKESGNSIIGKKNIKLLLSAVDIITY